MQVSSCRAWGWDPLCFWGRGPQLLAPAGWVESGRPESVSWASSFAGLGIFSTTLHSQCWLTFQRPGGCSWSEQILPDASCLHQPSYSIVTPRSVETAWWIVRELPMNPLLYFVFSVHPSFWLKRKFSGKNFFSPGSFLLFRFLKSYFGSTAIPTRPIVS